MCKINDTSFPSFGSRGLNDAETRLTNGAATHLAEGEILNNITDEPMEVTCLHGDGRTDNYVLKPGQSLTIDEDAQITITNASKIASKIIEAHDTPVKKN